MTTSFFSEIISIIFGFYFIAKRFASFFMCLSVRMSFMKNKTLFFDVQFTLNAIRWLLFCLWQRSEEYSFHVYFIVYRVDSFKLTFCERINFKDLSPIQLFQNQMRWFQNQNTWCCNEMTSSRCKRKQKLSNSRRGIIKTAFKLMKVVIFSLLSKCWRANQL